MDVASFKKEISGPGRRSFYFVHGGEPSAVKECLEAARGVVNKDFFDFNFQSFNLDEIDWLEAINVASTCPFVSPPRVIFLKAGPGQKFNAEGLATLSRYLGNPNPDSTMVLVAESVDERLKFFKDIRKMNCGVDCSPPQKAGMASWLVGKFKERGVTLSSDGAKMMIERLGINPGILLAEVDKLSIYPGPSTKLGPKEIKELVSLGPTAELYELAEPLARQDLVSGLGTLLDLLDQTAPMPLLYVLTNHFRKLMMVKASMEAEKEMSNNGAGSKTFGMHPYTLKKIKEQTRMWSWRAIKEAMMAIEDAHRRIVTSNVPGDILLEELAVKLGSMVK